MAKSVANPTPKISCWPPQKEVNLLKAILEIANEPVESYDPRINLFDRINKNMEKSLTDREILDKIKELRKRFKKRCWKIEVANYYVKRTVVFDISEKIWGKEWEMEIELKRKKKEEIDAKRCDDSSKVNPEEGSRPNHKREHELGKKQDGVESKNEWQPARKKQKKHVAHDCFEKKIAKQLTKQQHSEHISKGSVVLQLRAENRCKEPSDGSVFVSSKVNPQEASRPNCPQEASRPNCEREHELTKKRNNAEPNFDQQPAEQKVKERLCHFCRKSGHIVRDCVEKKIAKQPTKHQHTEDISNGSAVLQFRAENKCEELSGGLVFVSSRVNPREAFSPNCEREHELTKRQNDVEPNYELQPAKQKVKDKLCRFCKKFGHIARDCFEKKIAKQPTKQQENEDISKGSVVLQFAAENKCEELSGGSVFVSSKVNPQEASTPNCEREHELTTKCNDAECNHEQQPAKQKVKERFCRFCRKFGHIARDCCEKKIAKQQTKQQETEDISKVSVVLQFGEENKCEELSGGSVFVSSKVNPQEKSRPNCEREHELTTKCNDVELNHERQPAQQKVKERFCYFCMKFGHIARNCFEKKIAKQLTKQQETKDISKGSVELQLEAESKCEESSGESAVASSQPTSLQLRSEQTWQRGEVPNGSLPVAHEPFWKQRMKVYYSLQPNANQHASGQGIQAFSNFRPCAHEHRSHQMNPYNGFQPVSHQYPSDQWTNQWTRESFTPPIPPQPPNWGLPPIPPQPPNGGPPSIPPQLPNSGPPLQPPNSGPPLVPPQPPNWGPPSISQPPNWRLPPANWGLPPVPPQPANWELPPIPLQPPNCGPPPSPPQPPNVGPPPVPPQPPNVGPPPVPPQPSNWGPPPIPPQPDNWGLPSIQRQPPNGGLPPIPPPTPNCGPPPSPPQPPDGPPPLPPGPPPSPLQPPDGPPPLPPGPPPSPLQPPDGGPPPVPPQPPNWGLPPQPPNWGPPPIPPQPANWGPPPVSPQPPNWAPPPIPPQPSNWGQAPVPPKWGLSPQPPNWGPSPISLQPPNCGPPNPITMPYSYPAPPIPYQYPRHSMFLHKKL